MMDLSLRDNDIVKRLRETVNENSAYASTVDPITPTLRNLAADEIERLRAVVEAAQDVTLIYADLLAGTEGNNCIRRLYDALANYDAAHPAETPEGTG